MSISKVYNMDCMEYMKSIPDKFFDLAIVDPPYGLPKDSSNGRGKLKNRKFNKGHIIDWDIAPSKEYFNELFRVSKNQIIWGGNYFDLPPTRCFVCWDKVQPWENFSQVEFAWTSFDYPAKLFRFDNRTGDKIHPTQKPVELYAYLLKTFAKKGDRILDTHLGSGSSRIATYKLGFDFYGCEIDKDYLDSMEERFKRESLGEFKTKSGKIIKQLNLFG
nr:MAG TPA: adenine specific DNA methyltransferase [Caudoviricetes sp.]DAX99550.1 MAG TPA: adenine specific DNA methyltransferase [Caudoviricetes sp.]